MRRPVRGPSLQPLNQSVKGHQIIRPPGGQRHPPPVPATDLARRPCHPASIASRASKVPAGAAGACGFGGSAGGPRTQRNSRRPPPNWSAQKEPHRAVRSARHAASSPCSSLRARSSKATSAAPPNGSPAARHSTPRRHSTAPARGRGCLAAPRRQPPPATRGADAPGASPEAPRQFVSSTALPGSAWRRRSAYPLRRTTGWPRAPARAKRPPSTCAARPKPPQREGAAGGPAAPVGKLTQ